MFDFQRRQEIGKLRKELDAEIKEGKKIFLDCMFCGRITRVKEDSLIIYREGEESFETRCSDCYSPEIADEISKAFDFENKDESD